MSVDQLQYFAKYIESHLGIVYSEDNYFQLQNRLQEIVRYFRFASIDELHEKMKLGPSLELKQMMLDTATNNETSFFRDPKIFTAYRELIVPQMQKLRQGKTLRVWSAASSTGQEIYSLAIASQELKLAQPGLNFEFFASDISERVLKRVQEAVYTQLEVQRGLPTPLLLKYFTQVSENAWSLSSALKQSVRTGKVNLCEPFQAAGKFDIIFCRNILIYQRLDRKVDIVNRLRQQLNPDGFLVLGAGESMMGVSQDFHQKLYENSIVYQLKSAQSAAA